MKVTDEMIRAYAQTDTIDDGIQAVLDLIDPVPADVGTIYDRNGDRWWRSKDDETGEHWECNPYLSSRHIRTLVRKFGPFTWEGKEDDKS